MTKRSPILTTKQAATLERYLETGRTAHLYPRKRTISLNGHRALPIAEAIDRMESLLASNSPGAAPAVMAEETGIPYERCLVMCNCD